jgi:colanic acid/amylovoran biosynthesis glycosyltransferase
MRTKRKIVFIVNSFPTISETFIVNHAVACIDAGYEVMISAKSKNEFTESSQKELLLEYGLIDNIHIRSSSVPNERFYRYYKLLICFVKNLKEFKILKNILIQSRVDRIRKCLDYINCKPILNSDIIHVHFGDNGTFLFKDYIFKSIKNTSKIIVTFHGYDAHYSLNNYDLKKNNYRKLFDKSTYIIANSEYVKNKLFHLGSPASKTIIIPIGVDVNLFHPNDRLKKNKINIISVGRLEPIKGHVYGIRTIERLLELGYDLSYKIVGDGSLYNSLNSTIREKGLSEHIEILGYRSQKQIVKLLQESYLFLMTSTIDNNGRCEAFGLVSLEAQSVGLPIIAFDSGGVRDTIVDNVTGYLVKDKSIDEMVQQIIALIENKELYKSMSRNANLNILNRFKQEYILTRHLELYEN